MSHLVFKMYHFFMTILKRKFIKFTSKNCQNLSNFMHFQYKMVHLFILQKQALSNESIRNYIFLLIKYFTRREVVTSYNTVY